MGRGTPRIIYGQGQDIMPTATGPAPDHPGPPGLTLLFGHADSGLWAGESEMI